MDSVETSQDTEVADAALHSVVWRHGVDGRVHAELLCHAEGPAPCRLVCLPLDGDEEWAAATECGDRDHAHALVDTGACTVLASAPGLRARVEDLYDGPAGAEVHAGPVEVERTPDGWIWRYAAPGAATAPAATARTRWAA